MKFFLLCFLIPMTESCFAKAAEPATSSWKTFTSDVGYEFKYPACWRVENGEAWDKSPLTTTIEIAVQESQANCAGEKISSEEARGISISGGGGSKKTDLELTKQMKRNESNEKENPKNKRFLYFKNSKQFGVNAISYVEFMPDVDHSFARWTFELYCKDWWISVQGPDIRNPDKALLEKIKSGDLSLPEPEKTIIESLKCVPGKKRK